MKPITENSALSHLLTIVAFSFAFFWVLPLLFTIWTAFHTSDYSVTDSFFNSLTLDNFRQVLSQTPFGQYFINTLLLIILILLSQFIICTLAAYALVVFPFRGSSLLFLLFLIQMMVMPEILLVRNYATISSLGLMDTKIAIALPYLASAFGIFLMRQTFKGIPKELEEAARMEGAGPMKILWRVYVPLAKPIYLAYGLVMIAYHWNNFLWPLIVTNSVETRPITVGLQVFSTVEQGIDWPVITAATLISIAPLLIAFLVFQRQFVQSFMRAGIK